MIEKLLVGTLFVLLAALLTSLITRKYKQQERFEEFKTTFLPFIDILQKRNLPHGPASVDNLKSLFLTQDAAMLKIQDRLKGKRLASFTTKWNEYKEQRQNFEQYILAVVTLSYQKVDNDNKLLCLINEILKIAKRN